MSSSESNSETNNINMVSLNLIVAIDSKNGIGKDNDIPWHIPNDLKYFKKITTSTSKPFKKNIVIMGRKTWDSIPDKYKPLPNRHNFILTRNEELLNKTKSKTETETESETESETITEYYKSLSKAIKTAFLLKRDNIYIDKIFIIGGQTLYEKIMEIPHIIRDKDIPTSNSVENKYEKSKQQIIKDLYPLKTIHEAPENELYKMRKYISDITIYLTEIYKNYNCDTFLPKIDYNLYKLIGASDFYTQQSQSPFHYCFKTFRWYNNIFNKDVIQSPTKSLSDNIRNVIVNKEEQQYLDIVKKVIETGIRKEDRTGTGTLSLFGVQMKFNLRNKILPLLTTKRVFWKGIVEELLWFLRGDTNNVNLQARGVHIWDGNSSREFLDKLGFTDRKVGDCGPIYGFQFRHCGAKYKTAYDDYTNQGIDQLANVIDLIKNNPTSRRIIINLWNPQVLDEIVLPSCHCFYQFYVNTNTKELSCSMYQRSGDLGLGVPFNIASASLMTNILANICGLYPGELTHTIGDAHVYLNHVEPLKEQLKRTPLTFPMLKMPEQQLTLQDLNDTKLSIKDFKLVGYKSYPTIKMKMAV